MFNIVPTLTAIMALLVGLDMAFEGTGPELGIGALVFLAVVPLGELSVLQARRRKRRGARSDTPAWPLVMAALPAVSYAASAILFGLPRIVFILGIENWVLVDELLLLLPYPLATALGRLYKHRRARVFVPRRTWRQARMEMLLGFRGELALAVPLLLFILAGDLMSLKEGFLESLYESPALFYGFILLCLAAMVTVYPPLLKVLWRLEPLSRTSRAGRGLFAFLEAQRFEARNILVWNTGGLMINAAILGFIPRLRYILVTDTMLRTFRPEELKAVLAHEIGHGKRRHTLIFVIMSLAFIAVMALIEGGIDPFAGVEDELLAAALLYLPGLALYTGLVFGYLSRRFEVEADVFAARALGDPALFMRTLDRLGSLNARTRRRRTWRHFSLDRRIAILEGFFPGAGPVTSYPDPEEGAAEEWERPPAGADESPALARFEKRLKGMKIAAVALSLLALASLALALVAGGF